MWEDRKSCCRNGPESIGFGWARGSVIFVHCCPSAEKKCVKLRNNVELVCVCVCQVSFPLAL